jgi:hypothetical protein
MKGWCCGVGEGERDGEEGGRSRKHPGRASSKLQFHGRLLTGAQGGDRDRSLALSPFGLDGSLKTAYSDGPTGLRRGLAVVPHCEVA